MVKVRSQRQCASKKRAIPIAPRPAYYFVNQFDLIRAQSVHHHVITRCQLVLASSLQELGSKILAPRQLRRRVSTAVAAVQTFSTSGRAVVGMFEEFTCFSTYCLSNGYATRIAGACSKSRTKHRIIFQSFEYMMKALCVDATEARLLFEGIRTVRRTGERYLTLPAPVFRIHDDETKETSISISLCGSLYAHLPSSSWVDGDFEYDYNITGRPQLRRKNIDSYFIEWIPHSASNTFGCMRVGLPISRLRGASALSLANKIGL